MNKKRHTFFIKRKHFIIKLSKFFTVFLFWRYFFSAKKVYSAADRVSSDKNSDLLVIKAENLKKETIFKMTDAAFSNMGGIEKFIRKGMNVVIKPNIGFNSPPERAHTTNPHLVEAVAKKCIAAGANVKIFDRSSHTAQLCYKNSGITKAAENAGADIHYMDERKYTEVKIKNGLNINTLEVYNEILKADFVINIPIAKDHKAAGLTMAMKNLMGVIGGRRGWFHLSLHENIVDFNKAIPVHLNILDALRILTANGPASGTLKDVKETRTIVVGLNAVCVDAYTTKLFNKKPEDIEYIALAHKEKMGEIDLKKMNIKNINV